LIFSAHLAAHKTPPCSLHIKENKMAIFRKSRIQTQQYPMAMTEVSDVIYIDGQGHDATTLSPIINEQMSTGTGFNLHPQFFPMNNYLWRYYNSAQWTTNDVGVTLDSTLVDAGQNYAPLIVPSTTTLGSYYYGSNFWGYEGTASAAGLYGYLVDLSYPSNDFVITNSQYPMSAPMHVLAESTANVTVLVDGDDANEKYSFSSSAFLGYYTKPISSQGLTQVSGSPFPWQIGVQNSYRITSKTSQYTFMYYGHTQTRGESATENVNFGYYDNVVNAFYTVGPAYSFNFGSGTSPAYHISNAVNYSGTAQIAYMPTLGATSGTGMIKFVAIQYDHSTPSTNPTWTAITPTGDSAIPGATQLTAGEGSLGSYRAWSFIANSTVYVCVGYYQNPGITTNPTTFNYVWTYSAPVATPTALQFVSSVQIEPAAGNPYAIFPLDHTWQQFAVPEAGALKFYAWNQGIQNYTQTQNIAIAPGQLAVDQTGRVWAWNMADNTYNIYSPTLSSTATISFDSPAPTYSGTPVTSNVNVSVYSITGSRIAANITLNIDSPNATFAGSAKSIAVTTLSTADLAVPVTINGAGYVRVYAQLV
jgi:hypothetical protein